MQRKNAESGSRPRRSAPMGSPHGPCHDSAAPESRQRKAPQSPSAQQSEPSRPPVASAIRSRRRKQSGRRVAAQSPAMATSTSAISTPARRRAQPDEQFLERRLPREQLAHLRVVQRVRELREHAQVVLDGGAQEEEERPDRL